MAPIVHRLARSPARERGHGRDAGRDVPRTATITLAVAVAAAALLATGTASADTRIAAISKSSVPAISKDARKLPIDVASSHIDYKGDTVDFKDVVITQGETKVQADHAHATGLETFENSHWTFDGNVRINGEQQGSLRSDQAVVEFRNKSIAKAVATGNPAEFEQKRSDNNETARGRAHEIVYNVSDGTVRLSNDAWLSDGHNEISGNELTYSIREQRVQAEAEPGSDHRVHIKIDPQANDSNKNP
jgi:lipopolysaccharide transport protein LptA